MAQNKRKRVGEAAQHGQVDSGFRVCLMRAVLVGDIAIN